MRKSLIAAIAFAVSALVVPTTAHAADVAALSGTGTRDPGLPCPSSCHIHIDFTIARGGTAGADVSACTFDGDTGPDTALTGAGSGTFDCSGSPAMSGPLSFSRTGPVMTMTMTGISTPPPMKTFVCVSILTPLGQTGFNITGICVWI
jgi:hypothetical protein